MSETKQVNTNGNGGLKATATVAIPTAVLVALIQFFTNTYTSRTQETTATILPTPLAVEYVDKFVTVDEYNKFRSETVQRHNDLSSRLSGIEMMVAAESRGLKEITDQLKSMDQKLYQILVRGGQ